MGVSLIKEFEGNISVDRDVGIEDFEIKLSEYLDVTVVCSDRKFSNP
jgi:hypothetical protein